MSGSLGAYYVTLGGYLEVLKDFLSAETTYRDALKVLGEHEEDKRLIVEERLKALEQYKN